MYRNLTNSEKNKQNNFPSGKASQPPWKAGTYLNGLNNLRNKCKRKL